MEIGNFAVLLVLFIYIYALVGMEFFANKLHFEEGTGAHVPYGELDLFDDIFVPRMHFDDLLWASITVFATLTMENWNTVMLNCWLAVGSGAAAYFASLIVFGSFIIMNLFLAILLSNFEDNEELLNAPAVKLPLAPLSPAAISIRKKLMKRSNAKRNIMEKDNETESKDVYSFAAEDPKEAKDPKYQETCPSNHNLKAFKTTEDNWTCGICLLQFPKGSRMYGCRECDYDLCQKCGLEPEGPHPFVTLCGMLGKCVGVFRNYAKRFVQHKRIDQLVCFAIIASGLALIADNPFNDPESQLAKDLKICDYFFASFFVCEACIKIFALGVVYGEQSYFRNGWNILDFIVVLCAVLSLFRVGGDKLSSLKVVRVIRPLRIVQRFAGLKKVLNVMVRSIPTMFKTLLICSLFFLIFAILGVNYLKGTLYSCQGQTFDSLSDDQVELLTYPVSFDSLTEEQQLWFEGTSCSGLSNFPDDPTSRDICDCWSGTWDQVLDQTFDNVFSGMGTLYEISTTEGWVDVMLAAVDQRGLDMQPVENANVAWVVFFLLFMLFGCFFIMNLFVGVVIDFFNRERSRQMDEQDNLFATPEQKQWADTQILIARIKSNRKSPIPKLRIRRVFHTIANNPKVDFFILGCICLNGIAMALQYFGQSDTYGEVLDDVNQVFALIFTIEAIVKLMALGRHYFWDHWNKFDIAIVILTDIGLLIEYLTGEEVGSVASIIRLCRLARIFRVAKSLEGLNKLFMALVKSIPSFGNVAAILILFFYIYALCGVQLFAYVPYNENVFESANFRDVGGALLLLFRFSTGEDWNGYMYSLMESEPGCEISPEYNPNWCYLQDHASSDCEPVTGCGVPAAVPYFYSFILIIMFTMMNLFIGIILESIDPHNEESFEALIDEETLEHFEEVWQEADMYFKNRIQRFVLPQLLKKLGPPLGLDEVEASMGPVALANLIESMDIPTVVIKGKEFVTYEDVAVSLCKYFVAKKPKEHKEKFVEVFKKDQRRKSKSGDILSRLSQQWQSRSREVSEAWSATSKHLEAEKIVNSIEDPKLKQRASLELFLDKHSPKGSTARFFHPEKYSPKASSGDAKDVHP